MDPVIKACYGERLKWLAGKEQTQVAKCCSQALVCYCLAIKCSKKEWKRISAWCNLKEHYCMIEELCNIVLIEVAFNTKECSYLSNRMGFWSNILYIVSFTFIFFLLIFFWWISRIGFRMVLNKKQNDNLKNSSSNESIKKSKSSIIKKKSSSSNHTDKETKRQSSEKIKLNKNSSLTNTDNVTQRQSNDKIKSKKLSQKSSATKKIQTKSSSLTVSEINLFLK